MTIKLSVKQLEAKERLEDLLKSSHRDGFESYDNFDLYMKSLIGKIRKKVSIAKAVSSGKTTYSEINKRATENKIKYYNTEGSLRNYAIKYIQKYFPSYNKLYAKLYEKSQNQELSFNVCNHLLDSGLQHNDKILIEQYFNQYLILGKNYNKIKELLFKKGFNKDDISDKIEIHKSNNEMSILDPFTLQRRIERLLKQGKSDYFILSKLSNTKYDEVLIKEILEELNFDKSDIIVSEIKKLKNKGFDKSKIIQKMYTKGFNYDEVKNFI